MSTILPYVYGFIGGAACVGGWWLWISRKDKIRAAEQSALKAVKGS